MIQSSSVAQSCPTLRPHELQHARPPCPSPTPGVHSNSSPSSWWCHPAVSSSVVPFSSCPQSLPTSESFPMSHLFAWGGQSIGVSALALRDDYTSVYTQEDILRPIFIATRQVEPEKAVATHSSTIAWKIPWTEKPGKLQSMGSLRVGHNWATSLSLFTFMHWRRKWQPTPVFLPGESQGWGSLAAVCGVAQSWTRLKRLSSSSSSRQVEHFLLYFSWPFVFLL